MAWLTINNGCWVTLFRVSSELVPSLTSDMSCSVGEIHDYQLIFELHMQVKLSYGQGRCRESSRRRLMLRSRNHLDQNYKLSLHRLIFDGGVGAHQSEAENAVEDQQAVDGWLLAVNIVEKRYIDAELLSDLLEPRASTDQSSRASTRRSNVVVTSAIGTFRTCRSGLTMSVLKGKADLPIAYPDFSLRPITDIACLMLVPFFA